MKAEFWILIAFLLGGLCAEEKAYQTVATKCERQGSIYVGEKTFKCVEVKNVE